jgi:hypothetical protein
MAKSKPPSFVFLEAGASKLATLGVNMKNADEALALARQMADDTGRTIIVRDASGNILGTFSGAT